MGQDNEEKQSLIVKSEVEYQPPNPYPDYSQPQQQQPQYQQPPPLYPPQYQQHFNQQPQQPYSQQPQDQQQRQSYEASAPPQAYQPTNLQPQYPQPYQAPGYGSVVVGGPVGTQVINCRVCQVPITYNPTNSSFVKCNMCQHATQVGPPPAGKNFMICKCNTLLTYNLTSRAITCPKAECKSTIVLAPPAAGQMRASCAHCNQLLTFTSRASFIVCSKCRRRSMVNRGRWYTLVTICMILGIIFLGAGIILTVISEKQAVEDGYGYPIFFWGLMLSGVLFLIRGVVYLALGLSAPSATNVGV